MDLYNINEKFGDLPKEVKLSLFEAFLDGKMFLLKSAFSHQWGNSDKPMWSPNTIYKLAPEPVIPDTLLWEFIDEKYNWCARNPSGNVRLSSKKPSLGCALWTSPTVDLWFSLNPSIKIHTPGNQPWDKSLIQRPKNV